MNAEDSDLVLTLQSSVAYGHVGNAGAAFALQRLGRDVARIDTVRFSNHPKHGGYAGGPASAAEIDAIVEGLAERGLLANIGAVLSGYLGTAENALAVARAVETVRRARPDARYCLDPVIGDRPAGRFVAPDIPPTIIQKLLPLADIVTPNAFELEALTGAVVTDARSAATAARILSGQGRKPIMVVTGLKRDGDMETVAVEGDAAWVVRTPEVAAPAYGAGDLFCAIFLARIMAGARVPDALALAASSMHAVFTATARLGRPELALIEAQATLVEPPTLFPAEGI